MRPTYYSLIIIMVAILLSTGTVLAQSGGITVSWDPNDSSENVTEYRVYYKTGAFGPPYNGTGLTRDGQTVNSPVIVNVNDYPNANSPRVDLDNLSPGVTYRFTITACNENESRYSAEVVYAIQGTDPLDSDDDGDGFTENQGDCNDNDNSIYPGATETCDDGIDQDCNGSDSICTAGTDSDGDGYFANEGDCNDNDASVHPGASEICGDTIDQDCNGSDLMCTGNNDDNDGDSYTENQGDCNDNDASVHPGASEICGDTIDQDCNGADLACGTGGPTSMTFESGEVSLDQEWKTVNFNNVFQNPVVVANSISYRGADPLTIRIRGVHQNGFQIRVEEWDYLDGWHAKEKVGYIVIEAGQHELPNGIKIEAGTFVTDSHKYVRFQQAFNQIPVVVSATTSYRGIEATSGRLRNISTSGFNYEIQEQENKDNIHCDETISYIACEPFEGTIGGRKYIVEKTLNRVRHSFYSINFFPQFTNIPIFIADMQTKDGNDTANIRWRKKTEEGIEVQIDEEQSRDNETKHTTEVVGYIAIDLE